MRILHNLFPQRCVKHLVWRDNVLICRQCGRIAGVRYRFDGNIRIYLMRAFKPYEQTIREMPTTTCYVVHENVADEITFADFDDMIHDFRKDFPTIETRNIYEGIELDQERLDSERGEIRP